MGSTRRFRIDLLTPAERAIADAIKEIENLPADPRLTTAVVSLMDARSKVADYIDEQIQKINK